MSNVLLGFAVIVAVIGVGYSLGRFKVLGETATDVLARLAFFVLSPCLMFSVLSTADVHALFSGALVASALAAVIAVFAYVLIAKLAYKRNLAQLTVGALSAGYCNAGNIGIAISAYVLGNAAYSAPIMLFQMLVFAPVSLMLLDTATRGFVSVKSVFLQSLKNPMLLAALLGAACAIAGYEPPSLIVDPIVLIGGAAVPIMLINFGISLHGQRVLEPGSAVQDVWIASVIKLVAMPLAAWGISLAIGLEGDILRAVVVLAALPTAQNVLNYAQRYRTSQILARDSITITTVLCIPVLVAISALL